MVFKILIADSLAKEAFEILDSNNNLVQYEVAKSLSESELQKKIGDIHILIVRGTKVSAETIAAAKNLKLIARAGNGVDRIDTDAAKKKDIVVINSPEASATTTAEFAIALFMSAARHIASSSQSVKAGSWDRKSFEGFEIDSKVFGIIGLGRIGSRVAKRMKAFDCEVIANDPFVDPSKAENLNVPLVSLDELLKRSDFISVHTPLNESTKYLINSKNIFAMKTNAILVNAARGGIVEESAVLGALENNSLAAYATDVLEDEPLNLKNEYQKRLIAHSRVISTPHLGAKTFEAEKRVSIATVEQVLHYMKTGEATYRV